MSFVVLSLSSRAVLVVGFVLSLFVLAGLVVVFGRAHAAKKSGFDVQGTSDNKTNTTVVSDWDNTENIAIAGATDIPLPALIVSNIPPELTQGVSPHVPPHLVDDEGGVDWMSEDAKKQHNTENGLGDSNTMVSTVSAEEFFAAPAERELLKLSSESSENVVISTQILSEPAPPTTIISPPVKPPSATKTVSSETVEIPLLAASVTGGIAPPVRPNPGADRSSVDVLVDEEDFDIPPLGLVADEKDSIDPEEWQ